MNFRHNRAFTLVEIIVSLAVFAIVAVVALGALLKIIDTNKKAQTLQSALTNLSFSLESMSRQLRVGSVYDCEPDGTVTLIPIDTVTPKSCPIGNGQMIIFQSSQILTTGAQTCNPYIAYRFLNDSVYSGSPLLLEEAEQTDCTDNVLGDSKSAFAPIISPNNVTLSSYELGVTYDQNTSPFPEAYIRLSGYAGVREKDKTYFDLQTAVSARIP